MELLVVIGIIAVLIGILLPTLARARNNAMRIKCAAQLRQIGVASTIYANNNRGWLPPVHQEEAGSKPGQIPTYHMANPGRLHINWDVSGPNDPGANVGRLLTTKALASTAANWQENPIQWCPAAAKENVNAGSEQSRFNYYYNLHPKIVTVGGKELYQRWWPKLTTYGKVPKSPIKTKQYKGPADYQFPHMPYALATDPIFDVAYATHAQGKSRAWNLVYADGSVRTATTDVRAGRAAGDWNQFLDVLGYLERVADGQQLGTKPVWNREYSAIPVDPAR